MAITRRQGLIALAGAAGLCGAVLATTQALVFTHAQAQASRPDVNVDSLGLAIKGYDPVAYHVAGEATPGLATITARHDGATYRFASEANRALFRANPAKYAPAFGGFCAYGVAQGYKVKIEPDVFKIVDGKLYLNYDRSVGRTWESDIPRYLREAEGNWTTIRDKPRG